MEGNLTMFLKRNIEKKRRYLVFYTDGSLLGIEHNSKMCAGWIHIDVDSDRALIEDAVKLDSWPTSSKPELAAICFALLTASRKSKVTIFTDSATAISSIERAVKDKSYYKRLKEKNFLFVTKIHEII